MCSVRSATGAGVRQRVEKDARDRASRSRPAPSPRRAPCTRRRPASIRLCSTVPSELLTTTRRRPRACRRASASGTPGITLRHNTLARPSGRSTWRSSVTSASNSPARQVRRTGQRLDQRDQVRAKQIGAGRHAFHEQPMREARARRRLGASQRFGVRRDAASAEFGGHPVEVDRDERVADVEEHGVDVGVGNAAVRAGHAMVPQSEIPIPNPQSPIRNRISLWSAAMRSVLVARSLALVGRSRVVADRGARTGASTISSAHDATAATGAAARWARPSSHGCRRRRRPH